MPDNKTRQDAAKEVEERLLRWFIEYSPAEELTLSSVKSIAFAARQFALDAFTDIEEPDNAR